MRKTKVKIVSIHCSGKDEQKAKSDANVDEKQAHKSIYYSPGARDHLSSHAFRVSRFRMRGEIFVMNWPPETKHLDLETCPAMTKIGRVYSILISTSAPRILQKRSKDYVISKRRCKYLLDGVRMHCCGTLQEMQYQMIGPTFAIFVQVSQHRYA